MAADHKFNPGEGRVVRFEGACRNCGGTKDEHVASKTERRGTSDGQMVSSRSTTLLKGKGSEVGRENTHRILD